MATFRVNWAKEEKNNNLWRRGHHSEIEEESKNEVSPIGKLIEPDDRSHEGVSKIKSFSTIS